GVVSGGLGCAGAAGRAPAMGEAQHDLATTMRELGMAQDAIPHYVKALELMPGDLDSIVGLGAAQCDAGLMEEGIATLRKACEMHPDSGHAFANLGVALEKGHRDEEACAAYAKAIVRFDAVMMDASDEDAAADAGARRRWSRIQLAQILERLERWPQAVVEVRRLYEEGRALAEGDSEEELDPNAEPDEPDEDDEEDDEDEGADDHADPEADAHPDADADAFAKRYFEDEADAHADADEEEGDEYDDDEDAGRLGLERLFTQLVKHARYDLAYLVLD